MMLIEISPNTMINPAQVSAVQMENIDGVPKLIVYVSGERFIADRDPAELVTQIREATKTQHWEGR